MNNKIGSRFRRHGMVRWYGPLLLFQAGLRALITKLVGRISDNRDVQAALDPVGPGDDFGCYDYRSADAAEGLWIDYVADLGDGWESTFAVARALAAPNLDHGGRVVPRGRLLIMGGDEVYPVPTPQGYAERTAQPYRCASDEAGGFMADLFALPGNHDWYDGLHNFSDVFCAAGRLFERRKYDMGAWTRRQARSYFALRLPHDWWLCGFDVQLQHQLNASQLDYFKRIADELMIPGARVIICIAEPVWTESKGAPPVDAGSLQTIMRLFREADARPRVIIAGDLHHYSRYTPSDTVPQLITAGGGGAFLHPTHVLPPSTSLQGSGGDKQEFTLAATYPDREVSRRLAWKNIHFPFQNWDFALVIGAIYAVMAWVLNTRTIESEVTLDQMFGEMIAGHVSIADALSRFFMMIPKSPEFALLVLIVYAALVLYNSHGPLGARIALGLVHSAAHFVMLITTFCIVVYLSNLLGLNETSALISVFAFLIGMIFIGGILGGCLFGLFLLITLNMFGLQWTNAFSSLRIADRKNFLRLHIDAGGELTIYPFKIEKTGRNATAPAAIEAPVVIG